MDDQTEDVMLLKEIGQGSRTSFDVFYEKHNLFIFRIALHIVGDQTEAEDVCHDVFLEIFQKTGQYRASKGSVKAWMAVKTKSRALDRLRKKKPVLKNKMEELVVKKEKDAEVQVLTGLEYKDVMKALKQIPDNQREAIFRSYFQEESHKQIALTMNRPLGSIKSLIRYGINNLRKQKSVLKWSESGGGEKNEW